jgi:hypothetical protein
MKDWIEKLDDFIKMSGSELLEHAGKISHEWEKLNNPSFNPIEFEGFKNQDCLNSY